MSSERVPKVGFIGPLLTSLQVTPSAGCRLPAAAPCGAAGSSALIACPNETIGHSEALSPWQCLWCRKGAAARE